MDINVKELVKELDVIMSVGNDYEIDSLGGYEDGLESIIIYNYPEGPNRTLTVYSDTKYCSSNKPNVCRYTLDNVTSLLEARETLEQCRDRWYCFALKDVGIDLSDDFSWIDVPKEDTAITEVIETVKDTEEEPVMNNINVIEITKTVNSLLAQVEGIKTSLESIKVALEAGETQSVVAAPQNDVVEGKVTTICATGHRPADLPTYGFGYDYTNAGWVDFTNRAEAKIMDVWDGVSPLHLISGGAQGVDQVFFQLGQKLKAQYPDLVTLELAIPFENFGSKWTAKSRKLFADMRAAADKVTIISDKDYSQDKKVFQKRNEYMVNQSDYVLAGYNNRGKGGTYNTLCYCAHEGFTTKPDPLDKTGHAGHLLMVTLNSKDEMPTKKIVVKKQVEEEAPVTDIPAASQKPELKVEVEASKPEVKTESAGEPQVHVDITTASKTEFANIFGNDPDDEAAQLLNKAYTEVMNTKASAPVDEYERDEEAQNLPQTRGLYIVDTTQKEVNLSEIVAQGRAHRILFTNIESDFSVGQAKYIMQHLVKNNVKDFSFKYVKGEPEGFREFVVNLINGKQVEETKTAAKPEPKTEETQPQVNSQSNFKVSLSSETSQHTNAAGVSYSVKGDLSL